MLNFTTNGAIIPVLSRTVGFQLAPTAPIGAGPPAGAMVAPGGGMGGGLPGGLPPGSSPAPTPGPGFTPGGGGGGMGWGGGGFGFGGTRHGHRGFFRGGARFGRRHGYPYPYYYYYPYYYPWYYSYPYYYQQQQHPATPFAVFGTNDLTPQQARRYCNIIYAPYCAQNAATAYCRTYAPLCISRIGPPPGVASGTGQQFLQPSGIPQVPQIQAGAAQYGGAYSPQAQSYPWSAAPGSFSATNRVAALLYQGHRYPNVPEATLPPATLGEGWVVHNGEWLLQSYGPGPQGPATVPHGAPFRPSL